MRKVAYSQVYDREEPFFVGTTLVEPVNYPDQLLEEDLIVYLVGDWELNPDMAGNAIEA